MSEAKQYHRFRHYPGTFSTFDQVEECTKPKWCCGCEFKHALCTADGVVIDIDKERAKMAAEPRMAGQYTRSRR